MILSLVLDRIKNVYLRSQLLLGSFLGLLAELDQLLLSLVSDLCPLLSLFFKLLDTVKASCQITFKNIKGIVIRKDNYAKCKWLQGPKGN